MSTFSIQNRPRTISGESTQIIKLDHKYSGFDPRSVPAINLEELNSGIYALRHLMNALQSENTNVASLLNPNNTIFPTTESWTHSKNLLRQASSPRAPSSLNPMDLISEAALALVRIIDAGLTQFVDSVTEIDLNSLSTISTVRQLMKSYLGLTSLTPEQEKVVFASSFIPSETNLIDHVKQEKATEIQAKQDEMRAALEAQGVSTEEIEAILKAYPDSYAKEFIKEFIAEPLRIYRTQVGVPITSMNESAIQILPTPPTITPDNVNDVNGMITLSSILKAIDDAVKQAPALAGDEEIITMLQTLVPLSNKTTFTTAELKIIYTATQLPNTKALKYYLTNKQIAEYRGKITTVYQTAVQNLSSTQRVIENNRKMLEEQLSMFQQAQNCFVTWISQANALRTGITNSYTSSVLTTSMEMYGGLLCLSYMYERLSTSEKAIFDKSVNDYLSTQVINNGSWVNGWIAKMAAYQELAEYSLGTAVTTQGQIKAYLQTRGNELKNTRHFFHDIGNQMYSFADDPVFGNCLSSVNGVMQPNLGGFIKQAMINVGTVKGDYVSNAERILNQFNTTAVAHILQLQSQIAALKQKSEELDPGKASFTENRKFAVAAWLTSESLGNALIAMILKSQLPKQEAFLEPLIEEINFNNIAANALNSLLQITNEFATTSVYYSFSSYLVQSKTGNDLFAGDYYETLLAASREREYIYRDTARCKQAIALVNELLKKIQALPGATSAQKQEMLNATTYYQYSLSITLNQLTVLESLFVNLNMTLVTNSGNYDKSIFRITGFDDWIPTLAALESFLTTGFPNISATGGLGPLFTQVQSDQQTYTSQGQTQQLNLQNQMTTIQQEWTLVSTSMQVLNGILSQLATAIYPN
ncbi:CT620/CT621 family type III secretion system effector [Candidatus Chlamydia corallus]|uniref:CT620/CT621 family type III secretion system effector n=1 Tax=Candidatus Chlamydia corallus TaxID=2038470 RepID=UPI000C2FE37A|nr:CT620/CT621 family type III secretion system effector [Candidatus Chlamydia corallus]